MRYVLIALSFFLASCGTSREAIQVPVDICVDDCVHASFIASKIHPTVSGPVYNEILAYCQSAYLNKRCCVDSFNIGYCSEVP